MPTPDRRPPRILGTISTTSIVIGAIIGVGIFFNPSKVAALTQSPSLLLIAWSIGGLIALCGALVFAELGGMYHASGAQYQILRDSFGPLPAFVYVFCNATAIQAGVIGIIALICIQNLAVAIGAPPLSVPAHIACCLGLITVLAGANILGVRAGSTLQNITVAAKLLTLLAIAAIAFLFAPDSAHPSATGGSPASALPTPAPNPATAILLALIPIMFTYGGWQHALWISGEVKDPARTLPRAILTGVIIVIAAYLITNAAYLRLLGVEGMAQSKALAADAVAQVFPGAASRFIAAAVALSAFGILNAQLLSGPRLIYGMARDGRFFAPFARIHSRLGTPLAAILLLAALSIMLLLAATLISRTSATGGLPASAPLSATDILDRLLDGVMFIDVTFFALTGAALIVLRIKHPAAPRPVRVPGYPVIPILFIAGIASGLAAYYLDENKRPLALIGAAWIAIAAIVYLLFFRAARAPQHPTEPA
jgi:APA family basic amino acid/polyamine antiporter